MNRETNNPAPSRRERLRELVELAADAVGVAVDYRMIEQAAARLSRRTVERLAALCTSCCGMVRRKASDQTRAATVR